MVQISGNWEKVTRGGYGPSYLRTGSSGTEQKAVRFRPEIVEAGRYDVYVYFPKSQEGSSQTNILLSDGFEEHEITVKEADIRIEGQTSGEWVHLGEYDFTSGSDAHVTVSDENADGLVVADAALWVPVR